MQKSNAVLIREAATFRHMFYALAVIAAIILGGCSGSDSKLSPGYPRAPANFSQYVTMPDGVQLAVDVWLPGPADAGDQIPAIVEFTRYWRAYEIEPPAVQLPEKIQQTLDHDFAYIAVDVRGTGASRGTREGEFPLAEARDMRDIINWIAQQTWSNGKVVSMGVSYPGNTAEIAALYRSSALIASVPRFTDYDWYTSILVPGGLKNSYLTDQWGPYVQKKDMNDATIFGPHEGVPSVENPRIIGVKPVDNDPDRELLARATAEHKTNGSLADHLDELMYRDDYLGATSLDDDAGLSVSIHEFQREFEASAVPMYHWGSWFDGGTAAGILARFVAYDTPYKYIIGAWNHGAILDANPYNDKDAPVDPPIEKQYEQIFEFINTSMIEPGQLLPENKLIYFTVGENVWKSTDVWPPTGHQQQRWWLGAGGALSTVKPSIGGGFDRYKVNFDAGTGKSSRWSTQLTDGDVWYGGRSEADRLLLTYTSSPLEKEMEITGTVVVSLHLSSSHEDGALIIYLEDVDVDGHVRMLTEGEVRLIHRVGDGPVDPVFGPPRSFLKADGQKLVPGKTMQVELALQPVSALIRAGHSIRIAIAGHDKDTFIRVPDIGEPELKIFRNVIYPSRVDLPVIVGGG